MTSLYHDIIFGPVHSRRLGLSLGVNLLPTESKLCSFDCINPSIIAFILIIFSQMRRGSQTVLPHTRFHMV